MGRPKIDWAGVRQGRLTVVREVGRDSQGRATWLCQCACGASCVKSSGVLRSGVAHCSKSCSDTTHGACGTKEYDAWNSAKRRCFNPNLPNYADYGGRGITMHPAWVEDFATFYAEIGPAPTPRHTVERVDNERGYMPGNVRWATRKEQNNNRRSTIRVDLGDGPKTLVALEAEYRIPQKVLYARYRVGKRGHELVSPDNEGRN